MEKQSFLEEKVLNYPILKHFDQDTEIVLNPKGQLKPLGKSIMGITTAGVVVGGGYLLWTYILPPVMIMLGQFLALAATGIAAIALFMLFPVILKAIRRFAKASEKALIREDPFGELDEQKKKMLDQKVKFKESKAKIKSLRNTMQSEAQNSENTAKNYQESIVNLNSRCQNLKTQIEEAVKSHGKDSEEVAELEMELQKRLSEAQRYSYQLEQAKSFVQKYGTRAAVMKKLDINLSKAETAMDIKIQDFDVTIDMLKKDYQFAQTARAATDAAKSAMAFTKDWQLDYALDVVTSTISMDLARTSENLLDIDSLTSQYSIDNDEMFKKLDTLANSISGGKDTVPQSNNYNNPKYKLTESDKQSAQGFGDLF